MRPQDLTKDFSESVVVTANTANVYSPIIKVTVPKSRIYIFQHNSAPILKLTTAAAAEISGTSRFIITVRKPSDPVGTPMTGKKTYTAWRNTPLQSTPAQPGKTQYDVETTANRRILFQNGENLQLPQDYILEFLLQSPDVVDWTQATTSFEWQITESDVATQVAVGMS